MDLVINLNKPEGITSQEAVSEIKKILKAKRVGHTGTLDPFATGVLLVCTEKATRLASYFSSLDKEYLAEMKLGETTDTQDLTGRIIERGEKINVAEESIRNALKSFEGKILQEPPMFSALKHRGVPLYKFARRGVDIPRKLREVYIYNINLLDINLPFVTFRTLCSKGTYVRTLCDDIGKKLGIGAHLFKLQRIAVGPFKVDDAITFDEMGRGSLYQEGIKGIYSMNRALSWIPEVEVEEPFIKKVRNGNPIKISDCLNFPANLKGSNNVRVKSPQGDFLAVGRLFKNEILMDIVFS